jgi:hypothetical protein
MCVFLRLVAKKTDRFLEQRINIKFCVNASTASATLFEADGGEATKMLSVFEWHKLFKECSRFEITNEENSHHFLQCELIPKDITVNQAYYMEMLKRLREAVLK